MLRAANGVQHFAEDTELTTIRFDLRLRGGLPLFERRADYVLSRRQAPGLKRAADRLVKRCAGHAKNRERGERLLMRAEIPLRQNLEIEAAFQAWLAAYVRAMESVGEWAREPDRMDPRVQEALTILEEAHGGAFSEAELARRCGLSMKHLNRLFHRALNVSPYAYYDRLRAERARLALQETTRQVKQIAYELGFSSPAHFTNWFRRHHTASPRQFRESRKERTGP